MAINDVTPGLSRFQSFEKRAFDLFFSLLGLLFCWWLILLAALLATLDTGKNGFFLQRRVGRNGKLFSVLKIRTMRPSADFDTTVTTAKDSRITLLGRLFRKTKIDELPQLVNVLLGQMSFVGPRPDVPGFADQLKGDDRVILTIRPGITGPATLAYRREEEILAAVDDPEDYNLNVIFPEKVRMNREYIEKYSITQDFKYILKTILRH
jgi:lipopolysaccharide/colanic/teichoic acid biosynthesis glycosyltransferase